jgi:hypothetical protein
VKKRKTKRPAKPKRPAKAKVKAKARPKRKGVAKPKRKTIKRAASSAAAAAQPRRIAVDAARPYTGGLFGDWYERFDLYSGPLTVSGPLDLDRDDVDAVIVDGDLTVAGAVVNRDSDVGVALVVMGNLRATGLIAAGSEIVVRGDLVVDGIIFGYYNHGSVTVKGATRATAIITEYHSFQLAGAVDAITIGGRGRVTEADSFSSYAPALVPEILTEGSPAGGYPDWDRTADAILSGRPVLRAGVTRTGATGP